MGAIIFSLTRDYNFNLEDIKKFESEGFIISEITKSEKTQSFVFESKNGLKILIRTEKYLGYFYGDKIKIKGDLDIPESFENENGIVFNYQKYLQKEQVFYTSFYPQIQILEKKSKKDFKFYIFSFKENFVSKSRFVFGSQTESLVLGVLLGVKDSIDQSLEDNFRKTGLIHILVLSGFNLTIIAYFVFKLLSKFHRNLRYLISLFFIFIFVIMVGAGATIVRAGIMISLFVFSKLFYRNSNSFNALILAGSIMIFLNPIILLHDPSFQLSFLATLGLISFYPVFENVLKFIPEKFSLKEIVVSNISVQITIIPLLIYLMGEFSVISLLPNILILPLIPVFMLVSFLAIFLSFISKTLSLPFIFLTETLSDFIVFIVNYFGNLSFSIMKIGVISDQLLLSILFFYFLIILILDLRNKFILEKKYSYLQS